MVWFGLVFPPVNSYFSERILGKSIAKKKTWEGF